MTRARQRTLLLLLACARRNPNTILARECIAAEDEHWVLDKPIGNTRLRQAFINLSHELYTHRARMIARHIENERRNREFTDYI